mmetsp:Transcript_32318/g.77257  ORF Transcript_32318/g.77257 Transcript_32318/m.77257 type:complete len:207 (-) Transcript_32318:109-729(-)
MNAAISHKFGPHHHKERVEHIKRRLVLHADETAIKAPSKLDHLGILPSCVKLLGVATELLASLHGVRGAPLTENVGPLLPEGLLELRLGDWDLVRGEDRRLGRDGVVMLVDQLLLVDRLPADVGLREDLNALRLQGLPDHFLGCLRVGVRLDEHERGVFQVRTRRSLGGRGLLTPDRGGGSAAEHQVIHVPVVWCRTEERHPRMAR